MYGWGSSAGFFWASGGDGVIAVTAIGRCGGAAMVAGVDGRRLHAGGANLHVGLRTPYVDRRYLYVGPCTVLVDGANLSVDRRNLYVGSSTKGLGRCTV